MDEAGKQVYLNIYDISRCNSVLHWLGIGIYHTSVQILDIELKYGASYDYTTGVEAIEPLSEKEFFFR